MDWSESTSYLKGIYNKLSILRDPIRIAAFDLDDTLIYRPTIPGKWKLIDPLIVPKIQSLVKNNYIIIIFTNQAGMNLSKSIDKPMWRNSVYKLFLELFDEPLKSKIQFYFAIYVAKMYDIHRKPNLGMWEIMKADLKDTFELDKIRISKSSFYCGDAAGRIKSSTFKKKMYSSSLKGDFSDTDRKFAMNIGINFITPEELLLGEDTAEYQLKGMNPQKYLESVEHQTNQCAFIPRKKEMIIMIGLQGSGKSYFVKKCILPHGYVYINHDTCNNKKKCMAMAKDAVEKKKSLVIDNTNPDITSRYPYISLARDHNYTHIRAITMNTDDIVSSHLNNVRHIYSGGTVPKINKIAYNIFRKNYVRPDKSEHFDKIESVDFVFDKSQLDDPLWKKIFMKWSES